MDKLQSCLGGRDVKAMSALRAGLIPGTGNFFFLFLYDDDGGATHSKCKVRASTCRNERSICRRLFYLKGKKYHEQHIYTCTSTDKSKSIYTLVYFFVIPFLLYL